MENNFSLRSVWEVTKKYGPRVGGLLLIAYIASACGVKPNIMFEMTGCEDVRELGLAPGDTVDLTDIDPKVNFRIDGDGRIIPPSDQSFGLTNPGQEWWFGDRIKPYYAVTDRGDVDGDGLTNIRIEKVCPAPATPIPTIQPSETPIGYLGRGTGRFASIPRGFHPGPASKPAVSGRI